MPDLAMVPMLVTTSSRLIPMPLSATVMVRASVSRLTRIVGLLPFSASSGCNAA